MLRCARRLYATQQLKKCTFCGTLLPLPSHACSSCSSPAAISDSVSFYDYFNAKAPPEGPFRLDTRALRRQFLNAQQKVHPDNFSQSEGKRLVAESTSSLLNKAYTTLLSPLARAEYLLSLQNIETSEGEKLTDSNVLMTVMEAREEIEEASKPEDLENIRKSNELLIVDEVAALERAFAERDYESARVSAVKLRYWLNIQSAIKDWEPGQEIKLDH